MKHTMEKTHKIYNTKDVKKYSNNTCISCVKLSIRPCRVGSVSSVSASGMVGCEFASRPGHSKDHHKNGTNCLPAWHAVR